MTKEIVITQHSGRYEIPVYPHGQKTVIDHGWTTYTPSLNEQVFYANIDFGQHELMRAGHFWLDSRTFVLRFEDVVIPSGEYGTRRILDRGHGLIVQYSVIPEQGMFIFKLRVDTNAYTDRMGPQFTVTFEKKQ